MSSIKYMDVLFAIGFNCCTRTFVVPTGNACVGDIILHNGALFTVLRSAWFDINDEKYSILECSTHLYTPDKVLNIRWEKEDSQEADNGTVPGNP